MRAALPPELTGHPALWQGSRDSRVPAIPTGFGGLDRHLPGGGWPAGAITELLSGGTGLGEFSLLFPALSALTTKGQWLLLVDPPWIPYAPAMRGHGIGLEQLLLINTRSMDECLWACEQALRGLRGGAVLTWLREARQPAGFTRLRRLQLAAQAGQASAFLFRNTDAIGRASPAALRLHLHADARDLHLRVLKCRGARPGASIRLRRPHQEPLHATACPPSRLPTPRPTRTDPRPWPEPPLH